jgi:hypothetical protein
MPFEQGHNKSKGRPKGSSNKSTTKIREAYTKLLEGALDQLKEDFKELDPKDRIKLYLDLSKYVIPTLKQTEFSGDVQTTVTKELTAEEAEGIARALMKKYE